MTHSRWPGGRLVRALAASLMLAGAITSFGLARALASPAGCHNWTGTQPANPGGVGNTLDSVATTAADNTWAVGSYLNDTTVASLILHWNGTKWAQVSSPSPSPTSNFLFAVAASSASNAWAVGRFTDDSGPTTVDKTFAIHCC